MFSEVLHAEIGDMMLYPEISISHGDIINDYHINYTQQQLFKKERGKAATCDLVNGHGKEEDSRPGTELAAALEWSMIYGMGTQMD